MSSTDLVTTSAAAAFLLLDRSGSMATLWQEALGAINAYAEELAKTMPRCRITLAVFDSGNKYEVVREGVRAAEWQSVTSADASPRGSTPLYDAIVRLCADATKADYDKTSIVVMTDGAENASQEATKDTAKAALDAARARQWDVVFLGANWDAMSQAGAVGTVAANTMNLAPGNMAASMRGMAARSTSYSVGATAAGEAFTDDERKRSGWKP